MASITAARPMTRQFTIHGRRLSDGLTRARRKRLSAGAATRTGPLCGFKRKLMLVVGPHTGPGARSAPDDTERTSRGTLPPISRRRVPRLVLQLLSAERLDEPGRDCPDRAGSKRDHRVAR